MSLETVFFGLGIAFMVAGTFITIAMLVAVFVIRAKVASMLHMLEDKLNWIDSLANKGSVLGFVAQLFNRNKDG